MPLASSVSSPGCRQVGQGAPAVAPQSAQGSSVVPRAARRCWRGASVTDQRAPTGGGCNDEQNSSPCWTNGCDVGHCAVYPPSRTSMVPVTKRASSEQRYRTAATSSAGRANRPMGKDGRIVSSAMP